MNQKYKWIQTGVCIGFSLVLFSCKGEGTKQLASMGPGDLQFGPGGGSGNNQGSGEGEAGNIGSGGGNSGDGGSVNGLITEQFVQNSYTDFYDFLWVIDNSGSMSNIRTFMSQNLANFVNTLEARKSLDWQMAVTITDNRDYAGNLVSSSGGVRVVKKSTPNATTVWQSIITRIPSTSHSGWEQGLESGHSSIATYRSEFSRPGVPLIVTYVSDEQDYSCESNCNNFSGAPENQTSWVEFPVTRYVDQFSNMASQFNSPVTVYPIVHLVPLGVECDDSYGSVGERYMEVQSLHGSGTSLSLCSDKLEESFNRVAQLVSQQGVCFTLQYPALTLNEMVVTVDGNPISSDPNNGYQYESSGHVVCFNGTSIPGNGSVILVTYRGDTTSN